MGNGIHLLLIQQFFTKHLLGTSYYARQIKEGRLNCTITDIRLNVGYTEEKRNLQHGVINIMEGEVQAAIQGAPGSGKGTKKVFLKEVMFTQRPKNQLKLSEETQRIIKQYVHMPGVKTLSEPKEKLAGKGDWGMKQRSAFWGTGQGGPEERDTRWTWGQ